MRGFRALAAGAWSVAALLLGHELIYRIVFPDASERASVLHHTGHGWTNLLWPAFALFLVGAVVATVLDTRGDRRGRTGAFGTHAAAQALAYLVLELGERSLHAGSWTAFRCEVMGHRTWLLILGGVVVQIVCALGAAVFARVVARLARPRRKPTTRRHAWSAPLVDLPVVVRLCCAAHPRGPPLHAPASLALTNVC